MSTGEPELGRQDFVADSAALYSELCAAASSWSIEVNSDGTVIWNELLVDGDALTRNGVPDEAYEQMGIEQPETVHLIHNAAAVVDGHVFGDPKNDYIEVYIETVSVELYYNMYFSAIGADGVQRCAYLPSAGLVNSDSVLNLVQRENSADSEIANSQERNALRTIANAIMVIKQEWEGKRGDTITYLPPAW